MASIVVTDLKVAGLDLFQDQETYLSEVSERELNFTRGGVTPGSPVIVGTAVKMGVHAGLGFGAGMGITIGGEHLGWW